MITNPVGQWKDELVSGVKRGLIAVSVLWGALLLVLAFALGGSAVTVPEQRAVGKLWPAVDDVVVTLAAAAGSGVPYTITPYEALEQCRVTPIRSGAVYYRTMALFTPPGAETRLLDRLGERLPEHYRASVRVIDDVPRLIAKTAELVTVEAEARAPGEVQVMISTGCRPYDGPVATLRGGPSAAERAPVEAVLRMIGVGASEWRATRVRCAGGTVVGARAQAPRTGPDGRDLISSFTDLRWRRTLPAEPALVRPDLIAYRDGATSLILELTDTQLILTSTVDCP